MTPPPCLRCGTPVKRAKGSWKPERGHRIVDGVRWCWYCSRKCNGSNTARLSPEIRARIGRANHEASERRALKRIVALCQGAVDEHGMIAVKLLAKAWIIENRHAYARGFSVALLKWKRECQKKEAA